MGSTAVLAPRKPGQETCGASVVLAVEKVMETWRTARVRRVPGKAHRAGPSAARPPGRARSLALGGGLNRHQRCHVLPELHGAASRRTRRTGCRRPQQDHPTGRPGRNGRSGPIRWTQPTRPRTAQREARSCLLVPTTWQRSRRRGTNNRGAVRQRRSRHAIERGSRRSTSSRLRRHRVRAAYQRDGHAGTGRAPKATFIPDGV